MSLIRSGVLLFALSALFLPRSGVAQTVPSPYHFLDTRHDAGVFVGMMREHRGELNLGPGGGVYGGLRYGIHLGGPFVFEFQGWLFPTDREVWEPIEDGDPVLRGDTDALLGALEARLRFNLTGPRSWNGLVPFVLAGGGIVGDFHGRSSLEEDFEDRQRFSFGPSFLATLGGGAQWVPLDRLSFRAEGNLNLWKLGTPQAFFSLQGDRAIPEQEWPGVLSLVLGGSIRF